MEIGKFKFISFRRVGFATFSSGLKLYHKVWCDSATYPQGRPPPTSRFLNYLIEFSWSIYWASYSILLLVNLKVVLTIPSSQPKFPPCPLAPNFENPVTDNGAGLVESWGPGQLPGELFHFPGPFYIQAETDGPQGNESLPAVWPHPASLHHQGWGWDFYKTWQRMQWLDLYRRSGGLALRTWCLFALRSLALRPSTALLLCWLLQPTEKKKSSLHSGLPDVRKDLFITSLCWLSPTPTSNPPTSRGWGRSAEESSADLRTARKYRAAPRLHPQPCLNAQALETLKKGRLPSGFIWRDFSQDVAQRKGANRNIDWPRLFGPQGSSSQNLLCIANFWSAS